MTTVIVRFTGALQPYGERTTTGARFVVRERGNARTQRTYPYDYSAYSAPETAAATWARDVLGMEGAQTTIVRMMRRYDRGTSWVISVTPEYHATKYDSAADEVIAILSSVSEGYGKAETGDSDSPTGYFALVILNDQPDSTCDLDFADTTGAYPVGDEAGEVAREYGVTAEDVRGAFIVTHNSQGFVSVERFPSEDAARETYACREGAYAEWSDEDRAEDGDGIYVCPVQGHGYHSL